MFVLDTYFWTVLVLAIGSGAVIAALAASVLGGPPRHRRARRH